MQKKEPLQIEAIRPERLSEEECSSFMRQLFHLHEFIFTGVDEKSFVKKLFRREAVWNKIRIFKTRTGQWVGYCGVHLLQLMIDGQPIALFRSEAGILCPYRGQALTFRSIFGQIILHKILHPWQKTYFLCTLVHPSSFYLLQKYFHHLHPQTGKPVDSEEEIFSHRLAERLGEHLLPNQPKLCDVGWITIDEPDETAYWQSHDNPHVRYFLQHNPDYPKGIGLITLVPLTWWNTIRTGVNYLFYHRLKGR